MRSVEVSVRFGGNLALDEASLSAEAGQITGLIGPNGAGKTTLFNVITGLLTPTSGRILIEDEDVTGVNLHKRARKGLARTFQRLELFTMLTVRENIRVAADVRRRWSKDSDDMAALTESIIERVGLADVADVQGHLAADRAGPAGRARPGARLQAEGAAARRAGLGPGRQRDRALRPAARRAGRRRGRRSCWSSTTCRW